MIKDDAPQTTINDRAAEYHEDVPASDDVVGTGTLTEMDVHTRNTRVGWAIVEIGDDEPIVRIEEVLN